MIICWLSKYLALGAEKKCNVTDFLLKNYNCDKALQTSQSLYTLSADENNTALKKNNLQQIASNL